MCVSINVYNLTLVGSQLMTTFSELNNKMSPTQNQTRCHPTAIPTLPRTNREPNKQKFNNVRLFQINLILCSDSVLIVLMGVILNMFTVLVCYLSSIGQGFHINGQARGHLAVK